MSPQTVYAGSKSFRLEINGDRFLPEARIYFSQSELPTTFISPQKLIADIPANFIAQEGSRQIIIQTPDGKKYSNLAMFQVQAPPRPDMQYIGMIGRKRYNNDTAYFLDKGKTTDPYGARLNDVLGGRFRLVSIAPAETIFEDVSLGFRHRIALTTTPASGSSFGPPPPTAPGRGVLTAPGFQQYIPNQVPTGDIPGIPSNIPRYNPQDKKAEPNEKKDSDDGKSEDGDG
jgi:hypothetical protein